jgi:hypothetical protein
VLDALDLTRGDIPLREDGTVEHFNYPVWKREMLNRQAIFRIPQDGGRILPGWPSPVVTQAVRQRIDAVLSWKDLDAGRGRSGARYGRRPRVGRLPTAARHRRCSGRLARAGRTPRERSGRAPGGPQRGNGPARPARRPYPPGAPGVFRRFAEAYGTQLDPVGEFDEAGRT